MTARKVPPSSLPLWTLDAQGASTYNTETGVRQVQRREDFHDQDFVIMFKDTAGTLVGILWRQSFDVFETDVIQIGVLKFNVSRETYGCMTMLWRELKDDYFFS